MKENNHAARAARFLVQCFDVFWQTTASNFHISGSEDNASSQQQIFDSLPLHENHLAKQTKVHSSYVVQRDQHGIIAKDLT